MIFDVVGNATTSPVAVAWNYVEAGISISPSPIEGSSHVSDAAKAEAFVRKRRRRTSESLVNIERVLA